MRDAVVGGKMSGVLCCFRTENWTRDHCERGATHKALSQVIKTQLSDPNSIKFEP
jgi:hypothetical protein